MWSSILKIEIPVSLEEAWALCNPIQQVLFSGGTYLVAQKDPTINTLIDLNHLLNNSINKKESTTKFGAKATLQEVINYHKDKKDWNISQCAKWSCPSKNIRNQRTLGGEIAQQRVESELYAYLCAVNVSLSLFTTDSHVIKIRDWNGRGIITGIEFDAESIDKISVKRFALIPSSPAFVIVAGVRRRNNIDLTVGGRASKSGFFSVSVDEFTDEFITYISATAVKQFYTDHYGSITYKQGLIQTGLKRVRSEL